MIVVAYNSNLDEAERTLAEEEIASLLYENTELDDDECDDLSESILAIVLARFRPDLVLVSREN